MAFDFPASPTPGQVFSPATGVTYVFNGYGWDLKGAAGGGVTSLNTLTGALSISQGGGIGVTSAGAAITVTNTGVITLNGANGTVALAPGAGISVSPAGGTITIAGLTFTSSIAGIVPASGGGTSNFLRADGVWAAPAGGALGEAPVDGKQYTRKDATWSDVATQPHTFTAAQTAAVGTLVSSTPADFTQTNAWLFTLSAPSFVANPSVNPATGTYISITIRMTAVGALTWGNLFKGLSNYTQSTWSSGVLEDHVVFRWNGTNYCLVGAATRINL